MPIYKGPDKIKDICVGGLPIGKVYKGSQLVYQKAQDLIVTVAASAPFAATSPNGLNWTESVFSLSTQVNGVVFGKNKFVCSSYDSYFFHTENGKNWTTVMASGQNGPVVFGDDAFYSVPISKNIYWGSIDGMAWNSAASVYNGYWGESAFGNGRLVHIGQKASAVAVLSSSGWGIDYLPFTGARAIGYGVGKNNLKMFLCFHREDTEIYSIVSGAQGTGWAYTSTIDISAEPYMCACVNGRWLVTFYNSSQYAISDNNAASWTIKSNNYLYRGKVVPYRNKFLIVDNSYSLVGDGDTFTRGNMPTTREWCRPGIKTAA